MDIDVKDKKETKRQRQVDLLETDMIMQASPQVSMLDTHRHLHAEAVQRVKGYIHPLCSVVSVK